MRFLKTISLEPLGDVLVVTEDVLYETWKKLRKGKWCQVYRTTGQPCSCAMCSSERYSRVEFKQETEMELHEQLESE